MTTWWLIGTRCHQTVWESSCWSITGIRSATGA